jgi:hypothetical protein
LRGLSHCCWAGHRLSDTRHDPSGHLTGCRSGHVVGAGQARGESTQLPSEQLIMVPLLHKAYSAQSSNDDMQVPSGQRSCPGEQVVGVGQSTTLALQLPSPHLQMFGAWHCREVEHSLRQVWLSSLHNLSPGGQVVTCGQSAVSATQIWLKEEAQGHVKGLSAGHLCSCSFWPLASHFVLSPWLLQEQSDPQWVSRVVQSRLSDVAALLAQLGACNLRRALFGQLSGRAHCPVAWQNRVLLGHAHSDSSLTHVPSEHIIWSVAHVHVWPAGQAHWL